MLHFVTVTVRDGFSTQEAGASLIASNDLQVILLSIFLYPEVFAIIRVECSACTLCSVYKKFYIPLIAYSHKILCERGDKLLTVSLHTH